MSVRIALDSPHAHYTNLDFITGKVMLNLSSDSTISAISVKLEGESRTRLAGPRNPYDQRRRQEKTELEVHKLLYKVATVFPTAEIQARTSSNSSYTLAAGYYEYSFQFKFPFNNSCSNMNSMFTNLNLAGMRVEVARDTNRHVRKALPPTLSGFPGFAEIKYYVKVTVVRPQFYKENLRSFADFKFLPIEPPRRPDNKQETYARRQQQFTKTIAQPQKKGLFKKPSTPTSPFGDEEPPRFQVDVRLPDPAIITCNEPVPLRILIHKLSQSSETIFLQTLEIELMAQTHVRAHDLTRTEKGGWILTSQSNLKIPLGSPSDPVGREWQIPSNLWNGIPLPNTIAPSFDTCNISRTYELQVRVGLAHGVPGSVKPELIVSPLRLPVQVYSGIAPPAELLQKIADSQPIAGSSVQPQPNVAPIPQGQPYGAPMAIMPSGQVPVYGTAPASGAYGTPSIMGDDAPPSYEDAMAEDIDPVDGPRREYNSQSTYNQPGMPTLEEIGPVDGRRPDDTPSGLSAGTSTFSSDRKSSGLGRRVSERLFPGSTGFSGHSRDSSIEREEAVNTPGTEDGRRHVSSPILGEKQGPSSGS